MSKGSNRRRENTAQFNEFYKQVKWPERMTNQNWRNVWYAIQEFIEQERGKDD